eukprot:COSAG02_NODE_923_length_15877_cov_26.660920_4_plen_76_part_00
MIYPIEGLVAVTNVRRSIEVKLICKVQSVKELKYVVRHKSTIHKARYVWVSTEGRRCGFGEAGLATDVEEMIVWI